MSSDSTITKSNVTNISSMSVSAQKRIKSIDVLLDKDPLQCHWDHTDGQIPRVTFSPPLELTHSHRITLRLHYRQQLGPIAVPMKGQSIVIGGHELTRAGEDEDWQGCYNGAKIHIQLRSGRSLRSDFAGIPSANMALSGSSSELQSTTADIISLCPRFRILVIGKTGVGKSSLINGAFGVDEASVSHIKAGQSDINKEISSPKNDRFVLHDSQGFEHGEVDNLGLVHNFIERRSKMPQIKDQLHAIWLCFEIPRAGGRILETGVESFLTLKTSGKLGQIPVIAVFTKYDDVVSRSKRNMDSSRRQGLSPGRILEEAQKDADAIVQKSCVAPFEGHVKKGVPHMTVSTKKGYEETLSKLIRLTFDHVSEHVAKEASVVSAIAQKVNPGVKIDGSIAVGRTKYWKGLASSMSFPGKTLEKCLQVIHSDIVTVWSFEDPCKHLYSTEFKALISNMVEDLSDKDAPNPNRGLTVGLSMVGTIAGIVSALAGPAAPIVMPIAGCFVLAKWVYDVYQQSHGTLRRLMAYIIDLTLVMQNLFWLVAIYRVPVSRRLVKLAAKAYQESTVKAEVHFEVQEHVSKETVVNRVQRDSALGKIVELINHFRIDTEEMFRLRGDIGTIDVSGQDDEQWVVPAVDSQPRK